MSTHDQFRLVPFDHDRFLDANQDLVARMDSEGLFVLYDDQLDTLFVDIGVSRDGALEPLVDNLLARVDPSSLELLGYEIVDFRADFLPHNRLFQPMVSELRLFERPNERIDASETTQRETLRRLVAVS